MTLLHVATGYRASLKWAVVPVRGERPRVAWKIPPPLDSVKQFFDDPGTTGLAVVLGEPSGGLVVRDFDKPEAFEGWKREHPDLARTLPIALTGRPGGGHHVYGTMP